jgi:hypothetical protein
VHADPYLTSLTNYYAKYKGKKAKTVDDWKMSQKWLTAYDRDKKSDVSSCEFRAKELVPTGNQYF